MAVILNAVDDLLIFISERSLYAIAHLSVV